VFFDAIANAERNVHREIIVALSSGTQAAPITEIQIHRMVAERVNSWLAEAADLYPNHVPVLSALFEEWKKANQI
jgi:hypothetical protein